MKQQYQEINFRAAALHTIETANEIIDEYQADGLTLTLRQLYYQFVSRDLIPNTKQSYDNLGRVISNGRLAGLIDWNAIEDRTRFLRGNATYDNPADMISRQVDKYKIDMWQNQRHHLEVWIEKDALLGVIEKVCRDNDVDFFACRGYVSQSELCSAGQRMNYYSRQGYDVTVIHLGDHDPSGMDMTRDNDDRLRMFAGGNAEVRRIALSMEQVEQYNPPPNVAKLSDARAQKYIKQYGESSWELDALEPRVMQSLLRDTINEYKDPELWALREAQLAEDLTILNQVIENLED